jgi:hypothetical protein
VNSKFRWQIENDAQNWRENVKFERESNHFWQAESPESQNAWKLRDTNGLTLRVAIERCTEEFSIFEKKQMGCREQSSKVVHS